MIKRNIQTILLSLTALIMISLVSCDPSKKYEDEESAKIQNYLNSNIILNFELKPSGLYYYETLTGTGASPVFGDSAFIKYTGSFLDGTVFDPGPATGQTYGFIIGGSIDGFDEGITLMKEGGKAMLLIPSALAYKSTGYYVYDPVYGYYPVIPGYTPLLFDVQLVRIVAGSGK
jgi:FKBP-type peptidyl-prolyl cis-trans isomerase FkpA